VVPEQTDGQFQLAGQGSQEALDLSRIDISALEGELTGTAKLRWKPELKGAVDLSGQGLNPGVLLKDWPGKLEISLRAEGGIKGKQPSLQLQQLHAQGRLRGYEWALDAEGAYEEKVAMLKRFALSSGSTRLEANGRMGDTLDVSWQFHSEDLSTLLPNAKGRIDGKGALAGAVNRPQVKADLTAQGLAYSDYSLKSLNLDADVDLTGENQSRLSLALQEGNAAGIELRQIALKGQGDLAAHAFTLAADTSSGQADIALQGGLQNPWQQDMAWDIKLNQAKLKYPNLDGWALQAPSTGRITATQAQLSESCWQSGEALLCLQGQQSTERSQASFELTDLPFAYFAPYLPPDFDVQGSLRGKGTFSQSGGKEPSVNINLNTTKVRLLSQDSSEQKPPEDALIVEFQPGDIQLQMQQGGLQASMELPLSESDGIGLQAAIPPGRKPLTERPLKGQITTEVHNLDFIADLIPEVQNIGGRLEGKVALGGSLASPVLNGRLALVEGAAKLETPGLNLKAIEVELTGEGDGGIRLAAHAASGEGELNIDGSADLAGKATDADIEIKGQNFRVINTIEAKVDASPDLSIALRGNRVNVEGEVVIPKAQIKLKTLPESAVKVSDDQVIIEPGEQQEAAAPGRELHARVRIILGDEVSFNGFGLNARFEGNILAVEKPGEPTTGSGELTIVDGEYRAYGQGLVIEKGRVLFAGGPINQPGLDVRAVRRPAEGIVVGVQVRGSLKQPGFTLFSDPTLSQSNQLSYLVLGRPMSGTSDSEGSALSRAALALGLKGGDAVAGKIGGKLGLDQFGLETTEAGSNTSPEEASFVIGKYLTPELYVSYGLGLFDPVSTARLQYAINSRWKLVTESSSVASGGDVIYTIETGD
jgi:translocation and assembly module TamB